MTVTKRDSEEDYSMLISYSCSMSSLIPSVEETVSSTVHSMGSIERKVSPGVTETLKTLSYERMSVILWQCTRSLLARVETLEAKLAQ